MQQRPLRNRLFGILMTGLGVTLPVVLVAWLTKMLYGYVDAIFAPVLAAVQARVSFQIPEIIGNLTGVALTIVVVFTAGLVVSTRFGKWFHNRFDSLIAQVHPLYSPVRDSVKMLIDSLDSNDGLISRMVEVRSQFVQDGWQPGFLTGDCEEAFVSSETALDTELTVFIIDGPFGNSGKVTRVPKGNIRAMGDITIAEFLTQFNIRFGHGMRARLTPAELEPTLAA